MTEASQPRLPGCGQFPRRGARLMADVEEMGVLFGEMRGDQVGDDEECAGQLRVRAGDEA